MGDVEEEKKFGDELTDRKRDRYGEFQKHVPRTLVLSFAGAVICSVLAMQGMVWILGCNYLNGIKATCPPDYPYTTKEFYGVLMFTLLFPLSIACLSIFDATLFKYRRLNPWLRVLTFATLAIFSVFAIVESYYWSEPLIKCAVLGCVKSSTVVYSGFKATIGLCLFFLAIIFLLIHVYLALQTVQAIRQQQKRGTERLVRSQIPRTKIWLVHGESYQGDVKGSPSKLIRDPKSGVVKISDTQEYDILKSRRFLVYSTVFLLLIFLPFLFFICAIVPNSFQFTTPDTMKTYASVYVNHTEEACACRSGYKCASMCPEYPNATMKTVEWRITTNVGLKIFPDVIQFYGFIYLVILIAFATQLNPALYSVMHKEIQLWHANCKKPQPSPPKASGKGEKKGGGGGGGGKGERKERPPPPRGGLVGWCMSLNPFAYSVVVSVSEIVYGGLFICLFILWFYYWYVDHAFHHGEYMEPVLRAARTMGQVANLFLGLLMLPIARNSLFTKILGVSWESLVKFHRWLGYGMVISVAIHMFCWWKWLSETPPYFPHDILNVHVYYPGGGNTAAPCSDNFTIPLIVIFSILMFLAMGVFALYKVRREYFELFFTTHHIFMGLFFAAIWHGAATWFFLMPGLLLWIADRAIRFINGTLKVQVVGLKPRSDCTQLAIQITPRPPLAFGNIFSYLCNLGQVDAEESKEHGAYGSNVVTPAESKRAMKAGLLPKKKKKKQLAGPLSHDIGQYVFVNIPALSALEWHPFSISSAPTDPFTMLHIKKMGSENSFTSRLYKIAEDLQNQGDGQASAYADLTVNIDGPYGVPVDWVRYKRIVLVAGGIGITPCHSTFRGLYHLVRDKIAECTRVHLVWVCRDAGLFTVDLFSHTLAMVRDDNLDDIFSFSLYATQAKPLPSTRSEDVVPRSKSLRDEDVPLPYKTERPDLKAELEFLRTPPSSGPSEVRVDEMDGKEDLPTSGSIQQRSSAGKLGGDVDELDRRPPIPTGLTSFMGTVPHANEDSLIFACGTEPLLESASEAAAFYRTHYHAETFYL